MRIAEQRRGLLFLLAMVISAAASSCSAGDDNRPMPPGMGTGMGAGGGGGGGEGAPCPEGSTRSCHITLGEENGVLSCYDGVQTCEQGLWGECVDGTLAKRAAPPLPGDKRGTTERHFRGGESSIEPLSLSLPVACSTNPCDPTCQIFEEEPPGGIKPPPSGTIYDWPVGDLDGYTPGLVNKGLEQPCGEGSDCQFDHYCYNPESGSCAHSKCGAGEGLVSSCDPCVETICALDASCCAPSFSGSCAHGPCSTGGKLKSSCDPCVAKICAVDSYCCNNQWDAQCVGEVVSVCKKSCGPGAWSDACVDKVHSVCGAFCQKDAGCAHDKCVTGAKLAAACDSCVAQICAVDASCCTSAWNDACVDKVASVCNQGCGNEGACIPWLPGQKDPNCPGVDLTVGVPCDNTIPVCNHGNAFAPAGIKIVHFPANSLQYPKCAPDQSHPQIKTCTTTAPIPPGQCISVTGCPGLSGNREIMVNPPGAAYVNECSCSNNWSLFGGGSCGPPSCSAVKSEAKLKKVNMFVSVDKSGSMLTNGWTEAMTAMKKFFGDPGSAGLGVLLRFWPDNKPVSGCDTPACNIGACATPLVPLGTLTASPAPADTQEQALLSAINSKSPGGGTPMYPALAGATQWATNYQAANPAEQAVVVFITDGEPTDCNTNVNSIAAFASNAFAVGVPTYVIGIEGASVSVVNKIAQAGGTGQAFLVQKGANNSQVETQLLAALNAIKGSTVTCDLVLPNAGFFNPNDVSVVYTPGAGAPVVLPQVANAAGCGSGWYYDSPVNPSKISLCMSTCGTVKADQGAKVEVNIGCPPAYDPETYKQVYSGVCPAGTKIQWGFLAYETSTPGDSNVVFQAHTSPDPAMFSAPLVTLATAKASPSTQACAMSGPAPCPVSLFSKLGGIPNAQNDHLELVITANPTSDQSAAPTVKDWEITYSCPPSE